MFHRWSEVWLSPGFRSWTMVDQLPAIHCPVLALQGVDDEYGSPDQIRAITEGVSGPVEGLLLTGCAHVPHFQAPEPALAAMTRFITGTVLPGRAKS
jgi:pimeloyl-ACP methyl ester carboxylesterase